jgi:site-specific DNA-methyltransferase (adenine-specific)
MNYQLFNEDCLEAMKRIPSGSVDMVMADLPYGTTQNKWDSVIPLVPLWAQYMRICKGAIVLTASQPFTSILVSSNLSMFKHEWIWVKDKGSNFANTVREPMKEHESVLVFAKSKWTYNKQMQERTGGGLKAIGKPNGRGGFCSTTNYGSGNTERMSAILPELRVPTSWQKFTGERGAHPTQKPVALMEYLIRTYTNDGMTVLDNTMGSGTTGVACVHTNRNFIGIEREQSYFQIAEKRIGEALAEDPMF